MVIYKPFGYVIFVKNRKKANLSFNLNKLVYKYFGLIISDAQGICDSIINYLF